MISFFRWLTALACLLCALSQPAPARAQASSCDANGYLTSPTDMTYFSDPVTLTSNYAAVYIIGTANSNVSNVYWAFYLSVDESYESFNQGSEAGVVASINGNANETLDNMGKWNDEYQNQTAGWNANSSGSHTAYCTEVILCNTVYTPPSKYSGSVGADGFDDVDFNYYGD